MINTKENYIHSLGYLKVKAKELNIFEESLPVLDNEKFLVWSGASKPHQHHYGQYGLLIHTSEVVKLCMNNADLLNLDVDRKLLFLAALYHDIGKTWDYDHPTYFDMVIGRVVPDYDVWYGTDHKRHIHHISRSAMFFNENVKTLSDTEKDQVLHAILAHHGQREWGSPVLPNTKIAWMLHLCDGISARMDDADKWDHTKL